LKANITKYQPTDVIPGKYEELIVPLLSSKQYYNVFLYIDPYGIKALDYALFERIRTFGFPSIEMLINFNSFGFFREACHVLNVDYQTDDAFTDLTDLVEYEPTQFDTSNESINLLTRIAGGDYWKDIVRSYQTKEISGYHAERILSTKYKQTLQRLFTYVLDMPIRWKSGQRPKYRMIHACNHEDGCLLMADNMRKRKEFLYIEIQQKGLPLFPSTIEDDFADNDEIRPLLWEHVLGLPNKGIGITIFLATFFSTYGLLCDHKMLIGLLKELEQRGKIKVKRNPEYTKKLGRQAAFWEETKDQTVTISRIIP
jgi:three-Cys-motif partner protein